MRRGGEGEIRRGGGGVMRGGGGDKEGRGRGTMRGDKEEWGNNERR